MVLASDPTATILAFQRAAVCVFPWAFHEGTDAFGIWHLASGGASMLRQSELGLRL
jgi:hypothetical protein